MLNVLTDTLYKQFIKKEINDFAMLDIFICGGDLPKTTKRKTTCWGKNKIPSLGSVGKGKEVMNLMSEERKREQKKRKIMEIMSMDISMLPLSQEPPSFTTNFSSNN
ncbi:hypothetical protein AQUCO_06700011v1 [Aquilegia coerulea]|uniref:Uncharacterized protein n=1 Tax=Aquilegia coerulea TaxID=218851 RepID=A0A2G5CBM3_AQUCA|nr:hypothetical protein AQUCO_06700011v1 [Aquilegia coerulea]